MQTKIKTKRKSIRATQEPTFVGEHLVVDRRVCHGQLTFRGTRVPVETILSYLGRGYTMDYLHKSWPQVSAKAIEEAVRLASEQLIKHCRARKS
jgi:uncharacterized protein (DUF433 family)